MTLRRALAPEGDSVIHQGRPVHVASWAARFLFTGEQLNQPVRNLSGGERARVLIARLMLEPADVLLLDEPTNDLDIPTLEILEDNLLEFPGALVLVTHDRYLLNRVATTVLGLDGRGHIGQFADYAQWEAWVEEQGAEKQGSGIRDRGQGKAVLNQETPNPEGFRRRRRSCPTWKRGSSPPLSSGWRTPMHAWRRRGAASTIRPSQAMRPPSRKAWRNWSKREQENDALYARWAELTEKAGDRRLTSGASRVPATSKGTRLCYSSLRLGT